MKEIIVYWWTMVRLSVVIWQAVVLAPVSRHARRRALLGCYVAFKKLNVADRNLVRFMIQATGRAPKGKDYSSSVALLRKVALDGVRARRAHRV